MRRSILLILFVGILLISGCTNSTETNNSNNESVSNTSEEESLCSPPYIEYKKGECCLDKDNNSICDKDEEDKEEKEETDQEQNQSVQKSQDKNKTENKTEQEEISIDEAMESVVIIRWETNKAAGGSGFFVGSGNHLLTNWHVLEGYDPSDCYDNQNKICNPSFIIETKSGAKIKDLSKVSLVSYNNESDIALLEIDSNIDFEGLDFAKESNVYQGDKVFALGSPYPLSNMSFKSGLEFSTSKGILSGKREKRNSSINYYQTDSALNPGNSGGPLINERGRVVGMNTFGVWGEGLYFALSADDTKKFYNDAKKIECYPLFKTSIDEDNINLQCDLNFEKLDDETINMYTPKNVDIFRKREEDYLTHSKEVGFESFEITLENKDDSSHKVCFSLEVIRNGISVQEKEKLDSRVAVNPNHKKTKKISVDWWHDDSGETANYFFKVKSFDCESKKEYGYFYLRENY